MLANSVCGGVGGFGNFRGSLGSVSPSVPKVAVEERIGDGKCRACKGLGKVYGPIFAVGSMI